MHENKIPVKKGMLISCVISVLKMYDTFELEKEHHIHATENSEKEAMTFDAEFTPPQLAAPITKQVQATPAVAKTQVKHTITEPRIIAKSLGIKGYSKISQ